MTDQYILRGKKPVKCNDLLKWGRWLQTADRVVAQTSGDCLTISTVFLGLDHSFGGMKPLLFETMVFGQDDEICERCSTWEEAESQHARICADVLKPK